MVYIKKPANEGLHTVPMKGIDHGVAVCPNDGTEIPLAYKWGSAPSSGDISSGIACHDSRQGGCGTSFPVDSRQGVREAEERGDKPRLFVSEAVATGRTYSLPSDSFRDNYEGIFGHG